MNDTLTAEWIAVDWGTSNLRAYAMRGSRVVARAASAEGMGTLAADGFEPALRRLIAGWPEGLPIIACGMVGSRQGWVEAPYRRVPCAPLAETLVRAPSATGLSVQVIPGLAQQDPADVMRGEETQIAGFLALNPGWDGVLCLPGTHTKWAHLSAGEVVSFRTFMTGELFALLSAASVLRHSMAGEGWEATAFDAALSETISRPEHLAARLFSLRAEGLLGQPDPGAARAALSGLLIGAELAAAKPYWLGQNLAILGMGAQARAYARGLEAQGLSPMLTDAEAATLAGLTAAHRAQKETT